MADKFLSGLPLIGGLFDDSDEKAQAEAKKNQSLWEQLQTPDLQVTNFNPEVAAYAGDYTPEALQLSQIQEDPATRTDIMKNLNRMQYLADKGLSAEDDAAYLRANQEANQMAKGREGAIAQEMAARGIRGGGQELALRNQAAQDAANRMQMSGAEQAAQAARQRALYTQAYGSALSGLRGQDFSQNAANADIANKQAMYNTGERNTAQQSNLANKQTYGQYAAGLRNNAQMYNIAQPNEIAQQRFGNTVTKAQGQSGANTGMQNAYLGESAANQSARNANMALISQAAAAAMGGATGGATGGAGAASAAPSALAKYKKPTAIPGE